MDRKTRRRIRKARNFTLNNFPHREERNPTPQQEREQAAWLMGNKEFLKTIRHLPKVRAQVNRALEQHKYLKGDFEP
jgi:hypothetical protein